MSENAKKIIAKVENRFYELSWYMKCPYCGSEAGYYMYERVHRALMFSFDDEPIGASEDVTEYNGTRRRCINCHKVIPKTIFEQHR